MNNYQGADSQKPVRGRKAEPCSWMYKEQNKDNVLIVSRKTHVIKLIILI